MSEEKESNQAFCARVKEYSEKATAGPWINYAGNYVSCALEPDGITTEKDPERICVMTLAFELAQTNHDANLIAAARTDLPEAIRRLSQSDAELQANFALTQARRVYMRAARAEWRTENERLEKENAELLKRIEILVREVTE